MSQGRIWLAESAQVCLSFFDTAVQHKLADGVPYPLRPLVRRMLCVPSAIGTAKNRVEQEFEETLTWHELVELSHAQQ